MYAKVKDGWSPSSAAPATWTSWKPCGVTSPFAIASPADSPASFMNERRETCRSPAKKASRSSWCLVSMLFTPLLIGSPSAHEHSEGGRPRRVGGRGEIAQVALLAHRDRGLALRAHALARALTRHLLLGEGSELAAGERLHEGHQVVDLGLG